MSIIVKFIGCKVTNQLNTVFNLSLNTETNVDKLESLLKDYFLIDYVDKRKTKPKESVKSNILEEHHRKCPSSVIDKLKALRYSNSTIKTYSNFLSIFFTYHYAYQPQEITNEMI